MARMILLQDLKGIIQDESPRVNHYLLRLTLNRALSRWASERIHQKITAMCKRNPIDISRRCGKMAWKR
jgi:hypothetical protein